MANAPKFPYKLRRAFDDIKDSSASARRACDVIEPYILSRRNAELTNALLELRKELDEIHIIALTARSGDYQG